MRELKSPSVIFLPVRYNQWLVKDMYKSRLLLKLIHVCLSVSCETVYYLHHGRVLKRTVCQALGAIPVSEPNNWILRQLRVAFSKELNRRASAVTKIQVSLYRTLIPV